MAYRCRLGKGECDGCMRCEELDEARYRAEYGDEEEGDEYDDECDCDDDAEEPEESGRVGVQAGARVHEA